MAVRSSSASLGCVAADMAFVSAFSSSARRRMTETMAFIESLEGPPGPNVRCIHSFCCRRTLWDCHTIRWFTAFDRVYV